MLELLGEAVELRVGLLERRPALDRVGQEAGARRLERPAELLGDLHGGPPQHLGVELVGAALDLLLRLHEERDQLVARERVAVLLGFLGESVVDAGLPVDEGAVDIERDEGDFLGQRHRRPSIVTAGPGDALQTRSLARVSRRLWTSSNTRASSSSPATASRAARRARHHGRAGGRRRRRDRLPVRHQGAGAHRRPRQGRRHQARGRSQGGRGARPRDPRHGHPRLHRARGVGRGGVRHRRRVLRLDRLRPRRPSGRS